MKVMIEVNDWNLQQLRDIAHWREEEVGEVIERLLRNEALQARARQRYPPTWYALTDRQREIAEMVCLQFSNAQIAARLSVSQDTVKKNVSKILRHFGLKRRQELIQTLEFNESSGPLVEAPSK